jgi:hypothetical protein
VAYTMFWLVDLEMNPLPQLTDIDPDGGTFTLGGTDPSLYSGLLYWVNVPRSVPYYLTGSWVLPIKGELSASFYS